ncbi:hypothetical protein [Flavobacterium humi]|uniref:hypothetical protein n=1 Tax=Flavobacterium humi TaxID=2562683 RepID=UPI00146EDC19|nr:hypothetical protein [Flavobacterium humi]
MAPARTKTAASKKASPKKKPNTSSSGSETKSVASKQGLKKKLNEFGDDDAL